VSLAACATAVAAALAAWALGASGNHLPAIAISIACCLAGFVAAAVAAAFGSTNRDVWLGVTALIGNILIAVTWIVVALGILSTT
jgi:hypothetical protein